MNSSGEAVVAEGGASVLGGASLKLEKPEENEGVGVERCNCLSFLSS